MLISTNVILGHRDAREDAGEWTRQRAALTGPCRRRLIDLQPVIWDAPERPLESYDAVVIGPVWDYWEQKDALVQTLRAAEAAGARVMNSADQVVWNIDKGYLQALQAEGVAIPQTVWAPYADEATITAAFETLGAEEVVIKPRVGAGAWRTVRLAKGAPIPAPDALPLWACLIQPFIESVPAWGELSFMLYDGDISHALLKRPKDGDFRVQSLYGGREEIYDFTPEEAAQARAVVAAAERLTGAPLLYARVDMVRDTDGSLMVMECEAIEPYHYPEQGPACGSFFAQALDRFLRTRVAPLAVEAKTPAAVTAK